MQKFRDNRDNRNLKMVKKLQDEGFRITAEELYRLNPETVVARPHIARYLVDSGQVKDMKTVFDKYIGDGCKCYVDRYKITPMQAVALIHQAGGLAILAHPCLYKMKRVELTAMIEELVAAGLNGIEAHIPAIRVPMKRISAVWQKNIICCSPVAPIFMVQINRIFILVPEKGI